MSEYINLAVPFFSQRENTYTCYERWDKDVYDKICVFDKNAKI